MVPPNVPPVALSSATRPPQQAGRSAPGRAFAPNAVLPPKSAASLNAHRALMSRKSLSVEEATARARQRRRAAGKIQRFDRLARLLVVLIAAAGGIAWMGSSQSSIPTLLTGYLVMGLATAALIARLTRIPAAARLPLERYYLPDEQLASAEDIRQLRCLAQENQELEGVTSAWWRSSAPIRKGDVRLAVEFSHAMRRDSVAAQER